MSLKTERIASDILKHTSSILLLEARDETLKHVTLTGCDVSNDLSIAKIYYTYMGNEDLKSVDESLLAASPYIRTLLAKRLNIRHTPELRFIYDESIEYAKNIDEILDNIKEA